MSKKYSKDRGCPMERYYTIHEFSELLGVSAQTLRNWDKSGRLRPHHTSTNGYRYYSDTQLKELSGDTCKDTRIIVGYCRVSTKKQEDDLNRQVENMTKYLIAKGMPFIIIKDIGSGINYKKKGLLELIDMVVKDKVNKVVVLYKDRLARFGFELIEYLFNIFQCDIEVIDHTEKTEEQELVEDLIQIITVFSCRLQGKRAKKTRQLIKELEVNSDEE